MLSIVVVVVVVAVVVVCSCCCLLFDFVFCCKIIQKKKVYIKIYLQFLSNKELPRNSNQNRDDLSPMEWKKFGLASS